MQQLEFPFIEEWRVRDKKLSRLASLGNHKAHLDHALKYLPRPEGLDDLIGVNVRLCYHLNDLCCHECPMDTCDHTCGCRWMMPDPDRPGEDFIAKICLCDGLKAGLITIEDIERDWMDDDDFAAINERVRKWRLYEPKGYKPLTNVP